MDEENRIEEIFRERLYDFEYNLDGSGWAEMSSRLSRRREFHVWSRRVAVVAVLILLLGSGIWFAGDEIGGEDMSPTVLAHEDRITPVATTGKPVSLAIDNDKVFDPMLRVAKVNSVLGQSDKREIELINSRQGLNVLLAGGEISGVNLQSIPLPRQESSRKWRVGMGGGNLGLVGVGTNDLMAPMADNHPNTNPDDRDEPEGLSRAQSIVRYESEESIKANHSTPLSFGVSLSYPLGKRWSFQTGLTYSYLRSKWKDEHSGRVVGRQSLHLLGIPLGLSYRLTNWQRPYCYLNFGVLGEVNVAGRLDNSYGKHDIRIPGVLWTANARVGLAYPLIRFISVFAEGGICYYFEYSGNIETIRSEDAFNLTGQIGVRLNF